MKFIVEKGKSSCEQTFDAFVKVLSFLYVFIILHQNFRLEYDIFYDDILLTRMTNSNS